MNGDNVAITIKLDGPPDVETLRMWMTLLTSLELRPSEGCDCEKEIAPARRLSKARYS
jgi:hypothetical protein